MCLTWTDHFCCIASTPLLCGSGLQEKNFSSWWYRCDASRSTKGWPNRDLILWKVRGDSFQSEESLLFCDSQSASMFRALGRCSAEIVKFFLNKTSQISLDKAIIVSSRTLIWSSCSSLGHKPPVQTPLHTAPHPFFEASAWISTWSRWFWIQSFPFECRKFDIHQSSSSFAKAVNFKFIWNYFFNFRDCICNCWRIRICKQAGTTAWMVNGKRPKRLLNSKIGVQLLLYNFVHSSWTFCTFCKSSERVGFTKFTMRLRNSISWQSWSTDFFKFRRNPKCCTR